MKGNGSLIIYFKNCMKKVPIYLIIKLLITVYTHRHHTYCSYIFNFQRTKITIDFSSKMYKIQHLFS